MRNISFFPKRFFFNNFLSDSPVSQGKTTNQPLSIILRCTPLTPKSLMNIQWLSMTAKRAFARVKMIYPHYNWQAQFSGSSFKAGHNKTLLPKSSFLHMKLFEPLSPKIQSKNALKKLQSKPRLSMALLYDPFRHQ